MFACATSADNLLWFVNNEIEGAKNVLQLHIRGVEACEIIIKLIKLDFCTFIKDLISPPTEDALAWGSIQTGNS